MKIDLTKQDLKMLRFALMDAVLYEEDFADCHMNGYTNKPMRGSAKVVRRAKANIKAFQNLRVKLRLQEIKVNLNA